MKVLTVLDLQQNELQNAVAQSLASAPSSPIAGQMYYDSTLSQYGVYQNSAWAYTVSNPVLKTAAASAANVVQVSGGANRTLVDFISAGGIVKLSAAGVISVAVSGTDYAGGTSALGTGIVKTTTATGALTVAVASDFPTLNQNTTGTALNITAVLNATSVPAFTGDVTVPVGTVATTIVANAVTLAKMAMLPTATIVGNPTAGTATPSAISIGSGVSLSVGGVLSATGLGGTVTSESVATANGFAGTVATATTTPVVTLTTTVTGLLKGSSGAMVAAAVSTDYLDPSTAATVTNKVINATNNSVSNLTTAMFATSVVDIDGTFAANSDTRIPSQKAVATLIAAKVASASIIRGGIDASTNPNYPAGVQGDLYRITIAGLIGGASGLSVVAGDTIECFTTGATGTQAAVGANWILTQTIVFQATTSLLGIAALATQAETEANVVTNKAVVPSDLVRFVQKRTPFLIGDGTSTSFPLVHGLGTLNPTITIRDATTNAQVWVDNAGTSSTTATITFTKPPAVGSYNVMITY